MVVWIVFTVMTVVAMLAVVVPLARTKVAREPAAAHDIQVYRDQLAEIDRDRDRGLIGAAEAEAARNEIARRLLKADTAATADAKAARSWAMPTAVVAVVMMPAAALGIYSQIGSPEFPDQPLAARLQQQPGETSDINLMIARVEQHLSRNPGDIEGWTVLAPIYARLGRPADAADAYARIMAISGPTPDLQERYGELLLQVNEGIVTPSAMEAFDAVVEAEPDRLKSRFYRAMGFAQAGQPEAALADYDQIIRTSPADAPWLPQIYDGRREALMALGRPADTPAPEPMPAASPAAPRGPSPAEAAAVAAMSPDQQSAMIDQMVSGLAARLAEDPRDAEGWRRLIRAYAVLGRTEDAKSAYQTARTTFADSPAVLASLAEVADAAGIGTN